MPYLDREKDEIGLCLDLDVAFWLQSRRYNRSPPLRILYHEFVIVNSDQLAEFEEFKHQHIRQGSSFLQLNELLRLWLSTERNVSCVQLLGGSFVHLSHAIPS